MSRAEELALIRAVLEIGRKVQAMAPDPLYDKQFGREVVGSAMFYDADAALDLGHALVPLRQILDKAETRRRRAR